MNIEQNSARKEHMKKIKLAGLFVVRGNGSSWKFIVHLVRASIVAVFLFCAISGMAQMPPGFKGGPTNAPLDSWSFQDSTNWTSDLGYAPISFTNLNFSNLAGR